MFEWTSQCTPFYTNGDCTVSKFFLSTIVEFRNFLTGLVLVCCKLFS